ncbi:YfbU family protein [Lactococcus lactis]|uniref:YfbU family protein n=1 Tax=Lactococcus lactis TaxID=1358 RepID=UPI00288FF58A|nr:YfbU family protein [Lactococcus lactis]MDT2878135.1 YfbU family protein [Lactococcus lactis]MDT2885893.1 YfbU family protein [Lactococcus lactis]MDT2902206.1 YfbU family protein [Lactococcus lactis]MDT2929010.1 YfbU family protein [Lactococcus lactis]
MNLELSLIERLILSNQYETLIKSLDEDDGNLESYENALEIVNCGYTNLYYKLFTGISDHELSVDDCKLVENILSLYSDLKYARKKSPEIASKFSEENIEFKGFDGHLSKNYASYAEFLVLKEGRWTEFKDIIKGLDSHGASPDLDGLKSMVEKRKKIKKTWDKLTVEDVEEILTR